MNRKHEPEPRHWREKIGDREMQLPEVRLDVLEDVFLWDGNPRVQPHLAGGTVKSDAELEACLQQGKTGYDVLAKSIAEVGQMEPVYVWKRDGMPKYLVLEGATRVTILRDLFRKGKGSPDEGRFQYVTAKVLPPDFSEKERVILLARIHVRGTGVRSWGRYVEAKFIYENVTEHGKAPVTTVTELANFMGKSVSWVQRLRDAYAFAAKFVEHVDDDEAEQIAAKEFSTLEEISKSTGFGPLVRDYGNAEYDQLREEVFEMVRNGVFKEYRDARFMKKFYDDPEKWGQLKTHEKDIANKLAAEERHGGSSLAAQIAALPGRISRAFARDSQALDEETLENLAAAARDVASHLSGAGEFRMHLREFTKALHNVSLAEIKQVTPEEYEQLQDGLADFKDRMEKHKSWS
jgi:hypothetical protein